MQRIHTSTPESRDVFARTLELAGDELRGAWRRITDSWRRRFAGDDVSREGLRLVLPRAHESPLVMPGHSNYPTYADRHPRRNRESH